MNDIKNLKGSPSRDLFKWGHKQVLRAQFWAVDIDLMLYYKEGCLSQSPVILDYKKEGDKITPVEIGAYNALLDKDIPIFIIVGKLEETTINEDFRKLKVYKYNKSTLERTNLELVSNNFVKWETNYRELGQYYPDLLT